MPWSIFHCPKEFLPLFTLPDLILPANENFAHEGEEKSEKNSKIHTNSLVHKKWKINSLSILNTSLKRGEIKLIWPQISNCSDLHTHCVACFISTQASSISGTYFSPFWIFKLEALSDCISVPWASRHSNCSISISILLRTKGGTRKLYPPVQIPALWLWFI